MTGDAKKVISEPALYYNNTSLKTAFLNYETFDCGEALFAPTTFLENTKCES